MIARLELDADLEQRLDTLIPFVESLPGLDGVNHPPREKVLLTAILAGIEKLEELRDESAAGIVPPSNLQ